MQFMMIIIHVIAQKPTAKCSLSFLVDGVVLILVLENLNV